MGPKHKELAKILDQDEDEERKMRERQKAEYNRRIASKIFITTENV
jgi:hypothetical protein